MPDYASVISGASVAYGPLALSPSDGHEPGKLTSPTLASSTLPWADYLLHVLRIPGRVYAEDGDAALSASNSLGSCFAFQGGEGRLTVKLARPPHALSSGGDEDRSDEETDASSGFIRVTHVSIEHARLASAPSAAKSALRTFRVLGWDADPTTQSDMDQGSKSDAGAEFGALRPYVLVESAQYVVEGNTPAVQTFKVSERSKELAPPVGWVTLEVQSNYGGKWTCLYGFRVHGDPVDRP